jgi:serine/threonine protein phosphatase PrpC
MNLSNIYYLSEIGGKKNQEDYIWPLPGTATLQDRIFIVCDGVGGSESGEIASKIIAESVGNALTRIPVANISAAQINKELAAAKQKLVDYARVHRLSSEMATTFCMLVLSEQKSFISWSGDSRVYHFRNGEVIYKTSDHSLVNMLVNKGEISEEDALSHPQRNIILKAIKADDSPVEIEDNSITDIRNGDYFLLCTDGLFENLTDKDIEHLLKQNDKGNFDIINAIQQYCLNKTRDNYSMYLVKISIEKKPVRKRPKSVYLVLILILIVFLIIAGRKYFSGQARQTDPMVPVTVISDSAANSQDSIQVEIVPTPSKDSNSRP